MSIQPATTVTHPTFAPPTPIGTAGPQQVNIHTTFPQPAPYPINQPSAYVQTAFAPPAPTPTNPAVQQAFIQQALQLVGGIQHLPQDETALRQMGIDLIFRNGAEALQLIRAKNINIEFGDMGDSTAHAQWIADRNTIMINQKYQHDLSRDTLYAVSEAIYHEAGHAARHGDDHSSIQEECNCLALNTLAYRFHAAQDPAYAQSASTSRLIADGVALYPKLFFDPDPYKQALINRVIEKYGMLAPDSPDHTIPIIPGNVSLTDRVLRQLQANQAATGWTA